MLAPVDAYVTNIETDGVQGTHPAPPVYLDDQEAALLAAIQQRGRRCIPAFALYDGLGSTLHHALTLIPENHQFRAENAILQAHVAHIVAWAQSRQCLPVSQSISRAPILQCHIADLRCGSGQKTRVIVEAIATKMSTTLFAVDISEEALRQCTVTMANLHAVEVIPFETTYLPALRMISEIRPDDAPLLSLFLNSAISEFDADAIVPFLAEVREQMRPGDALLIGTEGIHSHTETTHQYNDALGIEAAFGKNALNFVNRALDGDFDLTSFDYTVSAKSLAGPLPYNLAIVEPALVARSTQYVSLRKAGATLVIEEGERLNMAHSVKFGAGSIAAMGREAGFGVLAEWRDPETGFTDTFFYVPPPGQAPD
ncbi:L-histidine N(alpha)-methyltransferase [Robbsia andropogonis]|uniref:L-histidine N(alpha)-methyltransferase n=1 Tax=Robbsia andropogonis TaxID=28092 RepID=UPI002A69A8F6|nr:L-histidine N(alpha)-methyltransferase [Robbsia andropogonis]